MLVVAAGGMALKEIDAFTEVLREASLVSAGVVEPKARCEAGADRCGIFSAHSRSAWDAIFAMVGTLRDVLAAVGIAVAA